MNRAALLERRMHCRYGHIWLTITWRLTPERCPFCGAGARQHRRGARTR